MKEAVQARDSVELLEKYSIETNNILIDIKIESTKTESVRARTTHEHNPTTGL